MRLSGLPSGQCNRFGFDWVVGEATLLFSGVVDSIGYRADWGLEFWSKAHGSGSSIRFLLERKLPRAKEMRRTGTR